jgi:WS/DGAT/MGAT family acyltransferase
MERLTPLAAVFLDAEDEDPRASLAIGSISVFEGPPPPFEDFVGVVRDRLPAVPRYRQKLRRVPFDLAPPAWVDDPAFDLRWHLRNTALPAPGGQAEMGRLVSRLMTQRMDRSRPLWECWVCEGLADNRWALISKVHHCMVDGVSGADLFQLMLDAGPEPGPALTDQWNPGPPESRLSFIADSAWQAVRAPAQGARAVASALRSPVGLAQQAARTTRGMLAIMSSLRPSTPSSLNGPLDGSRRYAWAEVRLADVRTVKRQFDGTVNDVALAVVTGAFRRLLISRGEQPTARTLRSLVPVSTRAPGTEGHLGNQVSLMLPYLPVELADPVARLRAIRERVRDRRAMGEPEAGGKVTTAAEYGPFAPVQLGLRIGFHLPQLAVGTVTTNVPGPRRTLYCLGRELHQLLPYVPIADRVRLGVAMFSYRDALTFGVTGDYEATSDIDLFTEGITESMAELVAAARTAAGAVPCP